MANGTAEVEPYVLIVVLGLGGSSHGFAAEFASKAVCEQAKERVQKGEGGSAPTVRVLFCAPKGNRE